MEVADVAIGSEIQALLPADQDGGQLRVRDVRRDAISYDVHAATRRGCWITVDHQVRSPLIRADGGAQGRRGRHGTEDHSA